MGKLAEEISENDRKFIEQQKMFFVSTAPLSEHGHINLSPKGIDSFRVLSATRVAYMDIIGSGNETSAHVLENGRITIMFCSFDGPPKILRLYGKGYTVLPQDEEWNGLASKFEIHPITRQIIVVDVFHVQNSCGFGVPLYDYKGERDQAFKWGEKKGVDGLAKYQLDNNLVSMDGLPTSLGVKKL